MAKYRGVWWCAQERSAPHALLCPLSHRLLREPARAADGYTYERANILDWFIAAGTHTNTLPTLLSYNTLAMQWEGTFFL